MRILIVFLSLIVFTASLPRFPLRPPVFNSNSFTSTSLNEILHTHTPTSADLPYMKVTHMTDPQARCLDGSPAILYLQQGVQTSKFLIFFVGGGYCGEESLSDTVENCYQRSKTMLGSSTQWPQAIVGAEGMVSTDPTVSAFANWTKVIVPYCDGVFHQGYTAAPLKYKDASLYFRGSLITRSHFTYLVQKFKMASATSVVLSGGSAGGVASYIWGNHLRSLLTNPHVLSLIPDSGVFISAVSQKTHTTKVLNQVQTLFKLSNVDEKTPISICNRAQPQMEFRCLFLPYAFTSIQPRTLLIESEYDSWGIENLIDVPCVRKGVQGGDTLTQCSSSEMNVIEAYRKSYIDFIAQFMLFSRYSVWTVSCARHGYTFAIDSYDVPYINVPEGSNYTVRKAVESFVIGEQRINQVDQVKWPLNTACAY